MPDPIALHDLTIIADNPSYGFGVGRVGDRWLGFALGTRSLADQAFAEEGLPVDPRMMFVLGQIAEGYELGVLDRDLAVRMTGAIAQDVESAYGGVDRWFVPEELRGKPDDFRCDRCDSVGCNGKECAGCDGDFYDGEDR